MLSAAREALTKALHCHVCGTEWDEWNQPCSWAGEDWDPDNGPATCAYVGEVGIEPAVFAWLGTIADDEALVWRVAQNDYDMHAGDGARDFDDDWVTQAQQTLRALAAALSEGI